MIKSPEREKEATSVLKRIAVGEEPALAELYDCYAPLLYSFTMRIVRSIEEAEDIIQDVFLQVWRNAKLYNNERGTVYTWLVTMARNKAIDKLRSKGFKKQSHFVDVSSLHLASESSEANPHTTAVSGEFHRLLTGALLKLSVEQQQVLALAYYEGYSQSEIAEKLDIPLGTVKSRMRKGLTVLRTQLEGML